MKKPVVAIFAHPDDEAFGPGATLAQFAEDRDVYLICVTNGNIHPKFRKEHTKKMGDGLTDIRKKELANSAKILGIKKVFHLDFPDGTLCNNVYHDITEKISEIITTIKPDTLVTFEPRGLSGHIDHIVVSLVTMFVFNQHNFIKKVLFFCLHEDHVKEMQNYFVYVPPGYKSHEIHKTVNVENQWSKKIQALEAHKSQFHTESKVMKLIQSMPKQEHFLEVTKDS